MKGVGSIVSEAFLELVSEQSLRTTIVAGARIWAARACEVAARRRCRGRRLRHRRVALGPPAAVSRAPLPQRTSRREKAMSSNDRIPKRTFLKLGLAITAWWARSSLSPSFDICSRP